MKYWYNEKTPDYPHSVIVEPGNSEGLLNFFTASFRNEVKDWLNDNVGAGHWEDDNLIGMVRFDAEEFALAFILRWS